MPCKCCNPDNPLREGKTRSNVKNYGIGSNPPRPVPPPPPPPPRPRAPWGDRTTLRGEIEFIIDPIISGGAKEEDIDTVVDHLLSLIK